jgi:hypothetical protein
VSNYRFAASESADAGRADFITDSISNGIQVSLRSPAPRQRASRARGARSHPPSGSSNSVTSAWAEEAGRQWQEWVHAHGDPLRLLLSQLERLGAVSVTDDAVRLEPLGIQAVRSKLERDNLFVPVLPAPDEMTPDDLVLVWMHGSDDDLGGAHRRG